jgi:endonuclease-3
MELVPRKEWVNFSHRLIHHGRKICLARSPRCESCPLASLCPKVGVPVSRVSAVPAKPPRSPARARRGGVETP